MSRPKEFDRDQVLDVATEVFWKRGFEATSIGDLVEALGIGRQSLYDTFGDKHALYLAALDRYRQRYGGSIRAMLDNELPVRRALRNALETVIANILEDPEGKTCMLVNAVAERCPQDDSVVQRFCSNQKGIEDALRQRFERAQREGEIAKHLDPQALARYFVNAINGLQITGKAVRDRQFLSDVADVTMTVLG
jgi:TetR/AcrR family transcriptional regulator, transcriptional repressor for nem operon